MSESFVDKFLKSEDRGTFKFDLDRFGVDKNKNRSKRKRR